MKPKKASLLAAMAMASVVNMNTGCAFPAFKGIPEESEAEKLRRAEREAKMLENNWKQKRKKGLTDPRHSVNIPP